MSSSNDGDVDISVVSSPESSPIRPNRDDSPLRNDQSSNGAGYHHHHHHLHHISHHHSTNYNHSVESRLSPPPSKSPPPNSSSPEHGGGGKTSANSGYTSFSISSILSRNEPVKKGPIVPLPTLPHTAVGGPQDAAMLTR